MRYSIFVRSFMRPEAFRSSELPEALELAHRHGGYVFDWWTWQRIEVVPNVRLVV